MAKKKKKSSLGEQTKRNIRIDQLQKEISGLKEEGKESFRPKIGRQIQKLENKIKSLK